ncbi:zinc phosphodiesterase ELAC protein 2-like isoform X2 [Anneissia japonica]|uniref:zinc phosphodiesterase ELAC protein 2-like isoform X2 n=1 Tax=Anneissia japonica TaxID=1529436 RepID=UPI0014256DE6|nr:zinc phosphodiesterase ELAC protein 2-like isoform X2 [Anneissia japonica]
MYLWIKGISIRNRPRCLLNVWKRKLYCHVGCTIQSVNPENHLTKLGLGKQVSYRGSTVSSPVAHRKKQTPFGERWVQGRLREFRTLTASNLCCNSNDNNSLTSLIEEMSHLNISSFTEKKSKRLKLKGMVGNFSLQVIGTGSLECPPSILVIADSNRYLFNCGEGIQRLLMENGVKNLSKLENIFLTRMEWENIGGLIGMTITLKNVGLPKVHYHGPPNMKNFVDALQIFAKHEKINIGLKPYTDGLFNTNSMSVTPVAIFETLNEPTAVTEDGDVDAITKEKKDPIDCDTAVDLSNIAAGPSGEMSQNAATQSLKNSPDDDVSTVSPLSDVISDMSVRQSSAGAKKMRSSSLANLTVAYICKVHKRPRSLIVKKALALGLPPGPKYTDLKRGLSVKTDAGVEIHPDDVLGPDVPSYPFIVLQCPSVEFLDSLCNNKDLQSCQAGNGENSSRLIIHITPTEVLQHSRYKDWMKRFHSEAEHLILNHCQRSASHESARGLQAKLNLMHPDIFTLLPEPKWTDFSLGDGLNVVKGETYLRYHIWPSTGFDRSFVPTLNMKSYVEAAKEIEHFIENVELFKSDQASNVTQQRTVRYPEVLFLGTGSAMPNKERNVSCVLLNLSEDQTMILDAGEGSFAQMCRFYSNQVEDVLFKLHCVFISHIHADHHVGLVQILRHWKQVMISRGAEDRDLMLVGPKRLLIWLNQYNRNCEDFIHKVRFIELKDFSKEQDNIPRQGQALLKKLNLTKFETVPVIHCANAYGVAITHQDGWKIVYSGDTMPCQALVEAGMDADLLIHEATLEDGMEEDARLKRHSMTSEAIDIGVQMRAKFILLTHFSQRYSKIPLFSDQFSDKVAVAFDNMKVSLSDVHLLPKLIPAMKSLFAEALLELEEIRDKKIEKRTFPLDIQQNVASKKQKSEN